MKKFLSAFLAAVIMMLGCMPAFAADEIPESYTPIYSAEDLDNIRNDLDSSYILMNHIDLSEIESWKPIGTYDAPFTGKLDGNGFSIVNMKTYEGLFDRVNSAVINNLGIVGCTISLSDDEASNACVMGAVAGQSNNSVFENCFVTGKIYPKIGVGLVALATFCNAGGLVGVSKNSTFTDCYNTADIHFTYDKISSAELGGLAGAALNTAIKNCYNSGFVSSEKEDRYSSGEKNVYIGGLVGEADENTLFTSCYFSDEIKVADGRNFSTPSGAEMLSDSQMKTRESYSGFDFDNKWIISADSYPRLRTEKSVISKEISVNYKEKHSILQYGNAQIVDWKTADDKVAVANDDGTISGVGIGSTVVTVTTADGQTTEINVSVSYTFWQKIIVYLFFGWIWY